MSARVQLARNLAGSDICGRRRTSVGWGHRLGSNQRKGAAGLLGYASRTAYMADVFGDSPLRLERDARQELVADLSAQGMSTRAIAPIVGVGHKTVARDLESPVSYDTPE